MNSYAPVNRYALVDCNNFYVSCERVFDPNLAERPVVVLSNNDGCVISRSNQVKALGIQTGEPYFKIQETLAQHNVAVYSSNYTLYGDMSDRVMTTLGQFAPEMEVYSIDEAFLQLPAAGWATRFGQQARRQVYDWTGIPVSIGIGTTKTLAKVANRVAKKSAQVQGVFDLAGCRDPDAVLEQTDVGDVWGIGRQYSALLHRHGIHHARALRDACDAWVRRHLTVVGLRTVWELRGTVCWPLDGSKAPKKNIASTRSFGSPVTHLADLREAVASFVARAAEKLRAQDSVAGSLQVFITTKHYGAGPHYTNAHRVRLPLATAYTPTLIKYAHRALARLYRRGFTYKKAGVILRDLHPRDARQADLFATVPSPDEARLMEIMDTLNRRYGRGTLFFAVTGTSGSHARWRMNQGYRSPRYTTRWDELMEAD